MAFFFASQLETVQNLLPKLRFFGRKKKDFLGENKRFLENNPNYWLLIKSKVLKLEAFSGFFFAI